MKIGMSTASYFNVASLEDAVSDIARRDVGLIEVFLNTFSEYTEEYIDLLCQRVLAGGLRVYSIHPMSTQFEPQLFSLHPRQRADALALYRRVLQAGRRLGAAYYVMHGPVFLKTAPKSMGFDRYVPVFDELGGIAAEYGIQLTLENVSYCVFHRPDLGEALRQRLQGRLKFTLDVKQAIRSGFSPFAYLDAIGTDLANVHLCDARTLPDGQTCLELPGEGEFDFSLLAERLRQLDYQGAAFIEVYSDMYRELDELYASLRTMERILG